MSATSILFEMFAWIAPRQVWETPWLTKGLPLIGISLKECKRFIRRGNLEEHYRTSKHFYSSALLFVRYHSSASVFPRSSSCHLRDDISFFCECSFVDSGLSASRIPPLSHGRRESLKKNNTSASFTRILSKPEGFCETWIFYTNEQPRGFLFNFSS